MSEDMLHADVICWRCPGIAYPIAPVMRRYAQDYNYWYYKCDTCGADHLEEKPKSERGEPAPPAVFERTAGA